jgi:hypothetical protein
MLSKRKEKRRIPDSYGKLMRFPLLLMRLIGLYHHKSDKLLVKLYSIIIILLMWCFFIKTIIVIDKKDLNNSGELAVKLVFLTCMLSTSVNATLIYINQESEKKEKKLIKQFNSLLKITDNNHKIEKKLSIKLTILFIIAIIMILLNCILSTIGLYKEHYLKEAYFVLLAPYNHSSSFAYKSCMAFLNYYFLFIWLFACVYFISHCFFIIELTNDFNEQFKCLIKGKVFIPDKQLKYDSIDQNNSFKIEKLDEILMSSDDNRTIGTEHEFEYFRTWHAKLCKCIKSLDDCYTTLIGVTTVSYIPLGFFTLYALIDYKKTHINDDVKYLLIFWFFLGYSVFIFVLGYASKVHIAVCK